MRKLVFSLFIVLFGFGFMACEQEVIEPTSEIELNEAVDPGEAGEDEEIGDRPNRTNN